MIPVIDNPAILALYATPEPAPELAQVQAQAQAEPVQYVRAPLGSSWSPGGRTEIRSTSEVVSPPAALPVPLAVAVTKARADGADMEAEVELEVRGIAGDVEHELQRALVEQTRRVILSSFPASIRLPMAAPLIEIEHVKFYDENGELQTLDPQDYLSPKGGKPAHVMPARGRRWPDTDERDDAVEVQYRCGFGADHAAVPAPIQTYILGRLEALHFPEQGKNARFLDGLLDGYRIYG